MMSLRFVVTVLFTLASLSSSFARSQGQTQPKVLAIGVDYADMIYHGYVGGYLYNEPKIRELVRKAKRAGFDELYWRVSAVGLVTYPSKVMTVMDGLRLTDVGFSPAGVILKQCDPLRIAIDEAHKVGLRLFVYVTLFDFSYPGLENQFFTKHPEYWSRLAGVVADRVAAELPGAREAAEFSATVSTGGYSKLMSEAEENGTTPYVKGVPSYGYPEVRQYLLSEVKELVSYKPDGIYFDVSRSHSGIYPVLAYGWYPQWTSPYLKYGYNEPEIAFYKKLYGKFPPLRGITSLQSLIETDEEKHWNAVRGSFLTEFLREASKVVHSAGMKVAIDFYPTTYNFFQPGTHTRQQLGRINIDWKEWSDEKLVDIIRLNVDHRKQGYDDWVDHSAETYKYAQDRGVHVYVDCAVDGTFDMLKHAPAPLPIRVSQHPDIFYKVISDTTKNILSSSADGVFYYEAGEDNERLYDAIRRGANR